VLKPVNPRRWARSYYFHRWRKQNPIQASEKIRAYTHYYTKAEKLISTEAEKIITLSQSSKSPVFIDCGTNEGIVMEMFREKLPNFRFIGFEVLHELIPIINQRNPTADIYNTAVDVEEGTIEIILPKKFSQNFRGGTTTIQKKIKAKDIEERRTVKKFRFVDFLNSCHHDFMVVKMDIEGAEYKVLDDYFKEQFAEKSREAKKIDYLIIEFHDECLSKGTCTKHYIEKIKHSVGFYSQWF
jgi:FkbM family methyltransferase